MRIHLDRKKMLIITFFLCCVLPAYFSWFAVDANASEFSGMDLMGQLLIAIALFFALALLFGSFRYRLILGIIAHVLLLGACLNCLLSFPLISCIMSERDVAFSVSAAQPMYWISLALEFIHLALFTTTEIAVQRLFAKK